MTKLAILSDVHADVEAVRDAFAQIERLGCSRIVCAGDLVDCGRFPEETIALLREREIPCIRGNHDRWALSRSDDPEGMRRGIHGPGQLSPEALAFLADLPTRYDAVIDGVRIAIRHGTPKSDMEGIDPLLAIGPDARRWLAEADADVLVVGHTHIPFTIRAAGGGLIVNPGALLRDPAEGAQVGARRFDPQTGNFVPVDLEGGTFGVLDLPTKAFTVHRAKDGSEVEILRVDVPEFRS